MSVAFVNFGCILPFHSASVIAFSVCNEFVGCLCPISYNIILVYTSSRVTMYIVASSASVADGMTCLIRWVMLIIALLFCGIFASLDKKK